MKIKNSDYLVMITSKETNEINYLLVKDCKTMKEATDKLYENKLKGMKASEWTISKIERLDGGVEIISDVTIKNKPKTLGKIKRLVLKNKCGKELAISMFITSGTNLVIGMSSPDNLTKDFLQHKPHIMYNNSNVVTDLETDEGITSIEIFNTDKSPIYIMQRPIKCGNDYFDAELEIVNSMSEYIGNNNLVKLDPDMMFTLSYTIK